MHIRPFALAVLSVAISSIHAQGPPIPPSGLFCCPLVGPGGLPFRAQQTGPFTIFCNYGGIIQCFYDPGSGLGGGPDSGCPTQAPANLHQPFCPSQPIEVHPGNSTTKCLDVRGAVFANGTPVQIYDCNGTGAQKWLLNRHSTKVRVAGTNFCLDAGSSPASGIGMKIWTCFDNLPAQEWFYTDDDRIALTGQGQCLDLTNGVLTNGNQVQTWQCTNNNNNQVWTLPII